MSVNQKYTWHDFLKEHPEHKEKSTKRTSPEGKKAFESAYKSHIKKYLSERIEKVEKSLKKASAERKDLQAKAKEQRKAGNLVRAKALDKKIGTIDAAMGRSTRTKGRMETSQKEFK
jgi:hypothetical protein